MDDKLIAQATVDGVTSGKTFQAGPHQGRLKDVLLWLRSLDIPWLKIWASLNDILAALKAGDWLAVVAKLIEIFGLPAGTAGPVVV